MKIRREDGEQEGDEPPSRSAPESREENCDSAHNLRCAADDIHRTRKRDVGRNHRQIRLGMKKMVHARQDEKHREQDQ